MITKMELWNAGKQLFLEKYLKIKLDFFKCFK